MAMRRMMPTDLDFAHQFTLSEGWVSETKEVFKDFIEHDPDGCFVAYDGSVPIGICVATKYQHNGFIGELIVVKSMRGLGYGRRLFEHAIQYLHSNDVENIYLDGDLAAVPFYERYKFEKICRSLRFVGSVPGRRSEYVRKATPWDADTICQIDRDLFGDDRSFFLKRRLYLYPDLCFVLEMDDHLCGYIMARPGNDIVSVGPWAVLDVPELSIEMLERIADAEPGIKMRIGVLESNTTAVNLLQSLPLMDQTEPCWRMVLGESAQLGTNKHLYAIGSAAKG